MQLRESTKYFVGRDQVLLEKEATALKRWAHTSNSVHVWLINVFVGAGMRLFVSGPKLVGIFASVKA